MKFFFEIITYKKFLFFIITTRIKSRVFKKLITNWHYWNYKFLKKWNYYIHLFFIEPLISIDRIYTKSKTHTHTHIHTDRHTQVGVSNIIGTSSCELPIGIELQIVSNTLIHSRHLGKYRFWLGENRAWSWCEWRGLMNFQRVNILNEGTWKKKKRGEKKAKKEEGKKRRKYNYSPWDLRDD